MPTVLDVSGAKYPEGKPALNGISLKPAFEGSDLKRTKPLFMEHENNAFLRDGDWKLVGRDVAPKDGLKAERWQLYNIAEDRTELKNLAKEMPDKVNEMSAQWSEWAEKTKVYPK
jgi:arylsulfatase A-like enzyme